ncbi:uncharacterized protein IL334_001804 [Kwoniella shivajii]|uniref:Uncharacterized protein n=1 Tax=Kwoniella shivajii TaxID=564305 RepID=A0ABZ1CSY1_9TREE|nr:hypothetical protein IL334_001804 [Kwoniella shivajii]
MLVHPTPPMQPRLPPIRPRTFSSPQHHNYSTSISGPNHNQSNQLQIQNQHQHQHQQQNQQLTQFHVQSPLAPPPPPPPPFFRRTSSLRDPQPSDSRSPSLIESEQDEDEFMAHQTRSVRRKVSRKKDEKL